MRRTTWTVLAGAAVVLTLAGCTASKPDATTAASSPAPSRSTVTATTTPSPTDTGPIAAGATSTAEAGCPFLTMDQALDDVGERLGKVTVSTSGGAPVGCAFYPATGALATSEHLPPPDVPVIAITLTRFADGTSAHNAMVLSSHGDPEAYSDPTPGADEAISFATTFYAADGDQDRAFTFRKGTTVVLVQLAQTTPAFNAKHVGTDVAAAVPST